MSVRQLATGIILMMAGCCQPDKTAILEHSGKPVTGHIEKVCLIQQVAGYFDMNLRDDEWKQILTKAHSFKAEQTELADIHVGEEICAAFNNLGLKFDLDSNALNWTEIKYQIACQEKPMLCLFGEYGLQYETAIVVGYSEVGVSRYLMVLVSNGSCEYSEQWISYEDYKEPGGLNKHLATWYNMSKK